jgi:hypothetical protein
MFPARLQTGKSDLAGLSMNVASAQRPCALLKLEPEVADLATQGTLHSQSQRHKLPLLTAPARLTTQNLAQYDMREKLNLDNELMRDGLRGRCGCIKAAGEEVGVESDE